jgi:predicted Zn-dependent protease
MRRAVSLMPLMALLLAGCATMPSDAPHALKSDPQAEVFSTYLAARFAAGEHDLPQAARYYGKALSDDPGNPSLLTLSFFYAVTSGDFEAAGKYAQSAVLATPDERSARLTLAVMSLKRKDYADARKQLSLSAKGPFSVLTLSLFDAWAAAAQRDEAGMQKDLQALLEQAGTENMAAFHNALLHE